MLVRIKTMAITGQGHLIHLISQNKRIFIWYRQLAHLSNTQVVRVSKLVDSTDLSLTNKKYDPAWVLIDFKDLEIPDNEIADPLVDKNHLQQL